MKVLYEDSDVIVVIKPHGVATQSAQIGTKDLESELKTYRRGKGEPAEIFVVHRLDQPVGGLLVFAKNKQSAGELSKALSKDSFSKEYKASVYCKDDSITGDMLVDYLEKDAKASRAIVCSGEKPGAKKAVLSYEVIQKNEKVYTLYIRLETGRFHQIRAQLAHHGMPILGDLKYGSEEAIRYAKENNISTVCLDAVKLTFPHPKTGKRMEFNLEEDRV